MTTDLTILTFVLNNNTGRNNNNATSRKHFLIRILACSYKVCFTSLPFVIPLGLGPGFH
jgi:hypothetical protein